MLQSLCVNKKLFLFKVIFGLSTYRKKINYFVANEQNKRINLQKNLNIAVCCFYNYFVLYSSYVITFSYRLNKRRIYWTGLIRVSFKTFHRSNRNETLFLVDKLFAILYLLKIDIF